MRGGGCLVMGGVQSRNVRALPAPCVAAGARAARDRSGSARGGGGTGAGNDGGEQEEGISLKPPNRRIPDRASTLHT